MRAENESLQTADQREQALRELGERVFFEFAEKALEKKSGTFKSLSPIEYARQGIEQFREVEKKWLPYEREDEELAL